MAGVGTDEEAGAADATMSALMFAKYLHEYNKGIQQIHSTNVLDHAMHEHLG